jgi:hypothetical protein
LFFGWHGHESDGEKAVSDKNKNGMESGFGRCQTVSKISMNNEVQYDGSTTVGNSLAATKAAVTSKGTETHCQQ